MFLEAIFFEINFIKDCQGQHGHSFQLAAVPPLVGCSVSFLHLLFLSNLQSTEQSKKPQKKRDSG